MDRLLEHEVVKAHEGIALLAKELSYGADPGWQRRIAVKVVECEINGLTHFGGSDVYLWWLAKQVREQGWDYMQVTKYVEWRYQERKLKRTHGHG